MNYLAAILSGLLAALSFPTIINGVHFPNLYFLAWFALIPFFLGLQHQKLFPCLIQCILLGTVWNGATSYWIFHALYFNGQLSWLGSLGVLAFMAVGMGVILSGFFGVALWLHRRWGLSLMLLLPIFWTLFEWVRNYGPFGGYPWANLGYSQVEWTSMAQVADLVGVYGITWLIVLVNLALSGVLRSMLARDRLPWRPLTLAASLMVAALVYGALRLPFIQRSLALAPTLKVALLQPNIDQSHKGMPQLNDTILKLLQTMSAKAEAAGVDLAIWPETSLPTALPLDLQEYPPLKDFQLPLLVGLLSTHEQPGQEQPLLYNSALLVAPGGDFAGRVHKQHLVPLGEYVPYSNLLWFLDPIVKTIGSFVAGAPGKLLAVGGHPFGVTICYEDLFPEISRQQVKGGAGFLVNMTNDAWYGDSSQLDQHLNFSRLRAIENRRSLVRATNTGYTAAIAPTGNIQAEIPKFTRGILLAEIPLLSLSSLYTRWGDIPLLSLIGLTVCIAFINRKKTKEMPKP